MLTHAQHAKLTTVAAFKQTLAEHCHAAATKTTPANFAASAALAANAAEANTTFHTSSAPQGAAAAADVLCPADGAHADSFSSSSQGAISQHLQLPSVAALAAMPLSDLAATVAGVSLDLADGRDILRLVTFRLTVALAFGLPVDALGMEEALQVVYKVAAFFKVRTTLGSAILFEGCCWLLRTVPVAGPWL